jgi:FMN-dependent NADH-azoreductase
MNILHLDSSLAKEGSASRELTAAIVRTQRERHPQAKVIYRDLATAPLAHFGAEHMSLRGAAEPVRSAEQQRDFDEGAKALDEFLGADVIVIGAPMYNFSIPSQLKAWIDRIALPGKTFTYTAAGPTGLAKGKKVVVASSRGGRYFNTPNEAMDHQESYLRAVLGFIGITDIEFVRAEGMGMGAEVRTNALREAHAQIASEMLQAA